MPANITHMLIAHKALKKLREKDVTEYTEFADLLDNKEKDKNYRAYMNLGSLGPDLYYYSCLFDSAGDMLKEGYVQAKGVTPWAYHLHSQRPNEFPLKLAQVLFRDVNRGKNNEVILEVEDERKLAYIAGHLTHIAADQIIHPVVNSVAGPYYRSGTNRKEHRKCEVFQDYFLYTKVYRDEEKTGRDYDFFEQDFRDWADCIKGPTTKNTEDWFRYFLQRGFVEVYGCCPTEEEIEDSADNLLNVLRLSKFLGPYKKAAKQFENNAEIYAKYIIQPDYIKYYRMAIELAVIYLCALYEVYLKLKNGNDFTNKNEKRFLKIVSDADLSCPLQKDILKKATEALNSKTTMDAGIKIQIAELLNNTKFVSKNIIFKTKSDKKLLKL